VRGELRVTPLTDDPRRFRGLREVALGERVYAVEAARLLPTGVVLLRLSGVGTPEEASALHGKALSVPVEEAAPLPEGAYYPYQLVGLRVETSAAESLGALAEVLQLPANDVYVVRGERGEVLIPALKEIVRDIDLEAGKMVVEPPPGLLPWETPKE
jgi:16S rRNA processing protein RimM